MPKKKCRVLVEEDFDNGPYVHVLKFDLGLDPDAVWREMNRESPLDWCRLLKRVEWTSPAPHSVGSTRTAIPAPGGVHLDERYFWWHETPERKTNAFFVESASVAGVRGFGERCEVVRHPNGSVLNWTFFVEPAGPAWLARTLRPLIAALLRTVKTDTERYFEKLEVAK